jgi:hypothetical protein
MNELVTVRKKIYRQKKDPVDKDKTKIRWSDKIVKMYLNDLLMSDRYVLTMIGKNSIRVDYLKDSLKNITVHQLLVISWTGIITRSNNKKLFDVLYLTIRMINE